MDRAVGLIGAPSSAGAYAPGQERAPAVLRDLGLVDRLASRGCDITDCGDVDGFRWRPDPVRPLAQNLDAVAATAAAVAGKVDEVLRDGRVALVLGGDCTVGVGSLAGVISAGYESAGLVYFDLHADLNTPGGVPDGALDWMGVAHMLNLDDAAPPLAGVGDRMPLIQPEDIVLYGFRDDQATGAERERIRRLDLEVMPFERVAADPSASAQGVLESLGSRCEHLLVHFDVDVVDFTDAPLSENTGRNVGLTLEHAFAALRVLLASGRIRAVTITELNPEHGEPEGATVRRFVEGFVSAV
ncbi:MAG: arginase family protein [Gaiellales bacterium]